MDPITIAAKRFMREHETAWNPPPGQAAPAVLRLECAAEDRTNAVKALRVLEWQPENRRPFVVFEAAFDSEPEYLKALVNQLERDIAATDEGLRKDGIERAPAPRRPASTELPAALAYAEALARHVASFLDGLVVVLAPSAVPAPQAWIKLVQLVAAVRPAGSALRVDVLSPTVPELREVLPIAARFQVDRAALFEYLKQLGSKPSQGPADDSAPKLSPDKRRAIEKELGQPLISMETGHTLKVLMMEGSRALQDGAPKVAVRKLRAARMLCDATGLVRQGALITIGLGTAYIGTGNMRGAEAAYQLGQRRAVELNERALDVQACFGLGQLRIMMKRFIEARPCFERIVELEPEESPLRAEALRLVEVCKREDVQYGLSDARAQAGAA
ncbi:MAG: hypothetical protein HOW73_32125 [Polyangiaceae bacterium]|nr:hypothetical protein [Polyangiaceae bacterium]